LTPKVLSAAAAAAAAAAACVSVVVEHERSPRWCWSALYHHCMIILQSAVCAWPMSFAAATAAAAAAACAAVAKGDRIAQLVLECIMTPNLP
jgi:hypothetical protein